MISLIGFVFTIALLVFIHEYGHYYVAKSFGVRIEQFSIGFGKELYSKIDKDGVKWRIGAIPLGGYVKMYGDANPASFGFTAVNDPARAFYAKSLLQRFLIVAAGPLANYLLAIIIIASFYFAYGKVEVPPVIGEVIQDSPASRAGLLPGDMVLEAEGKHISNFGDLQKIIMMNANHSIPLLINRSGEEIKLFVTPSFKPAGEEAPKMQVGYMGIKSGGEPIHINMGILASSTSAFGDVVDISRLTIKALSQMVTGRRSVGEIYGPLTIAKESGKSLSQGPLDFILFIAMLSINLGLINLLPIPILDGGHLALIIYEGIARRPLSQHLQNILLKAGVAIIIFLIVISISNDIKSLIF